MLVYYKRNQTNIVKYEHVEQTNENIKRRRRTCVRLRGRSLSHLWKFIWRNKQRSQNEETERQRLK